ncbi:PQQ-binding-like beta-propeller repeat protein [bacterium]|nr:PQQ-binding-like beta-propeller repeat protein [bacterium]
MLKEKIIILFGLFLLFISCQKSFVPYNTEKGINTISFDSDLMLHQAKVPGGRLTKIWYYKSLGAPSGNFHSYKGLILFSTKFGRVVTLNPGTGKCIRNRMVAKGNDVVIAISDSIIVTGLKKGKETLRAFNAVRGNMLWKQNIGAVSAGLAVESHFVAAGTEAGWIYFIDTRDGKIIWKRKLRSRIEGISIKYGLKVYAATNDGTVYCLSIGEGNIIWLRKLYGSIFSPPAFSRQRIFAGTNQGRLFCLSDFSGEVVWQKSVPGAIFKGPAADRYSVFFGTTRSTLYSLKISDGSENWSVKIPGVPGNAPLLTQGLLFSGTLTKKIVVVETSTGKILTTASVNGRVKTDLQIAGDVIIAGTDKERIYGFKIKHVK